MFAALTGRSRKGYTRAPSTDAEMMKMGLLNGSMQDDRESSRRAADSSHWRVRTSWRSKFMFVINSVFLALNLIVFGTLVATKQLHLPLGTPRNWHQRMTSMHSPIFDAMDLELRDIQWEGNLFNNETSSIFRQPPSPDVDRAWWEIADLKTFLVDRVDIERVGKDPEMTVRAPASWGVGEKWIAQLDGPHQLHCLDQLRRQIYSEYYYGPEGNQHPIHWNHITHCLDIVRQSLMCTSSTDLITFNFLDTQPGPQYDFNANHRCRNHQAILAWADEHEVDWEQHGFIGQPEGYPTAPTEAGYFDLVPALRAWNAAHGISSSKTPPPVPAGTNHQHGHVHAAYAESHH